MQSTAVLEQAAQAPERPKRPVWVRATGTQRTLHGKARYYLKRKAWAPTSQKDRLHALLVVMCNLRLYHRLPIHLATAMVREHYNPRCLDGEGKPCPWSDEAIRTMYKDAGRAGMYPTLGVNDPKAKQKAAVKALQKELKSFLKRHTGPGGSCHPTQLREAFIAYRGGVDVNATAFGRAVFAITGIRSTTPFGDRVYRGFHILETGSGLARKRAPIGSAA